MTEKDQARMQDISRRILEVVNTHFILYQDPDVKRILDEGNEFAAYIKNKYMKA